MPRLPQPGADAGQWGVILNDYLSQSHNTDGSLKSGTVTSASLANASITQSKLSATGGTNGQVLSTDGTNLTWSTPAAAAGDATTTSKGVIQLSGDLAGTADAPTVPELDQKENTIAAGTTSQYYRGDKSWQTLNKAAVSLSNVDNTSDANKPVSNATQTALNAKADENAVVHLSGNETITGTKNFTGTLQAGGQTVVATNDSRLSDTRVPTDASVTDAKIATTLSPSKITGTALTQTTGDARYVRTVNGTGPDGSGNVTITTTIPAAWRRRDIPDPALVTTLAAITPTITLTQQATSTISGAVHATPDTGPFLYRGAADFAFGASFPDTTTYQPSSKYNHTWGSQSVWSVEFMTDASVFEMMFKYVTSGANYYRLKIDGRRVTDLPQVTGASSVGSRHVLKFDLGTSAPRHICFEFYLMPFGGIFLPPTATIWKPSPFKKRWAVLGDSLTNGSGMNTGSGIGTWTYRTGDYLGWDDPFSEGVGGTGFVNPGSAVKFGDRVSADVVAYGPSEVVVWGGYNDVGQSQGTIATEVDAVLTALKSGLPSASIYVIGCWSPTGSPTTGITDTDATLLARATAASLPFISPISGNIYNASGSVIASNGAWITGTGRVGATTGSGNADLYIGTDAAHPTDAGHAYLARRIAGSIAALLSP